MSITDKLQSIRQSLSYAYKRPSPETFQTYRDALKENTDALDYLHNERKFTETTIEHFKLGYCEHKDAIAIPVFKYGELIDIKYRKLSGNGPKYLREPETETWLFNDDGLTEALKVGRILIVEGEFDAMAAWQAGFKAVISPSSGKDSYGVWLEQVGRVQQVYIAYDNDTGGQESAAKLAKRLGEEKCYILTYPTGIKDANDYFKDHTAEEFRALARVARPYYQNKFNSLGDVIHKLRNNNSQVLESSFLPGVKMRDGWMVVVSGRSNVGKTSYVLNMVQDFGKRGIPTLVFPFERGIESVGERFLHVVAKKSPEDFSHMEDEDWDKVIQATSGLEVYFALPERDEAFAIIEQAKKILDTRVVVIDHLDYMVRNVRGSREEAISNTLQALKRLAEENGIILILVTHIRKVDGAGYTSQITRPGIEDMKGSSSLYQDPEVVVMLSQTKFENEILVDVVKNKGEMVDKTYEFIRATGQFNSDYQRKEVAPTTGDLWNPSSDAWKV